MDSRQRLNRIELAVARNPMIAMREGPQGDQHEDECRRDDGLLPCGGRGSRVTPKSAGHVMGGRSCHRWLWAEKYLDYVVDPRQEV